jgi:hypothetical protein
VKQGIPSSEERKVLVRVLDANLVIGCGDNGDLIVDGDDPRVVSRVYTYMHSNLISRGWTLTDVLRVAHQTAEEFHGEVLDIENILGRIRQGWIRLLKANLMGDPAHTLGQRMNEFMPCRGISVTVQATPHHVLHDTAVVFDLGDPQYLIARRPNKRRWRARWERLTRVSFTYSEPPPEWLHAKMLKQAISSGKRPSQR